MTCHSNPAAIEHTADYVHVAFPSPRSVISAAVLNGGAVTADHILNLRVDKNRAGLEGPFEPSEITLDRYCGQMGWTGTTVGMMTAADMTSYRKVSREEEGVTVTALVTVGISNAKRAGEPAECRDLTAGMPAAGTINIIILTDALLLPAAMVEAVQMVTEAKTAALQNLNIQNPRTGALATGTGTDAVAVASGAGPVRIRYCGKHMLFGEILASVVIDAITSSRCG